MAKTFFPAYVDQTSMDRAFEQISDALQLRRADFLFGAGMSRESELPTAHAIALELLKMFFPETGTSRAPDKKERSKLANQLPLEALAQAVESSLGLGRERLTVGLSQALHRIAAPSQAHRDFVSICHIQGGHPQVDQVFTTNFDRLLELAFGEGAIAITEDTTHETVKVQRDGRIPIIYLHGTLEGEYQITESDVFDKRFRALHSMFQSALNSAHAFIFVGYSMSDPDFRAIYLAHRNDIQLRGKMAKTTFVVGPADGEHEYRLGEALWKARGAVWIPLTAGEFFGRLKGLLIDRVDEEVRSRIMKNYGLAAEAEFTQKLRQTSEILKIDLTNALAFLSETRTKTGKSI
jgi:hypothetical protein